jgi:hypothetical protein
MEVGAINRHGIDWVRSVIHGTAGLAKAVAVAISIVIVAVKAA